MNLKSCPKCGAQFIDGKVYWSTGKEGTAADLAGLVCDDYGDATCINEVKGTKHGGDTWEKRAAFLDGLEVGLNANLKNTDK